MNSGLAAAALVMGAALLALIALTAIGERRRATASSLLLRRDFSSPVLGPSGTCATSVPTALCGTRNHIAAAEPEIHRASVIADVRRGR